MKLATMPLARPAAEPARGTTRAEITATPRFHPISLKALFSLMLVVAISAGWSSRSIVHSYVMDWDESITVWRASGTLSAAIAAAFAAYVGQWRFAIADASPRLISTSRYYLAHVLPITIATLGGMWIGVAPRLLVVINHTGFGRLPVSTIVSQILAVAATVCVAFLFGNLSARPLVPALAGLAIGAMSYISYVVSELVGFSVYGPAPFWMELAMPIGWHDRSVVGWFRSVQFALMLMASIDASIQVLQGRSRRYALRTFILPVLFAGAFAAFQPRLIQQDDRAACSADALVCVPLEASGHLGDIDESVRSIVDTYGLGVAGIESTQDQRDGIINISIDPDSEANTLRQAVEYTVSRILWSDCEYIDPNADSVYSALLARTSRNGSPLPDLAASDAELRDWIARNAKAMATCEPTTPLP